MVIVIVSEEIVEKIIKKPFNEFKKLNKEVKGEELISKHLRKLENNYVVLNNIKFPWTKSNTDHILIGNNGVFLI